MKAYLTAIALFACSGCASMPVASVLPMRSFVPNIALTALAKSRLTVQNGCIRIGDALIIWPLGSHLEQEGKQQIVITGDGGRYVVGSYVSLGGGSSDTPPTELMAPLPPRCGGPFFSAN